jgi:hypothetical protein
VNELLSVSLHGERLTCARGPVNEDGAVLAIQKGLAQLSPLHFPKRLLLSAGRVQYLLEGVLCGSFC